MARKTKSYVERLRKAAKTLRSLKLSGDIEPDTTLIDFLDKLNVSENKYDRILEAESVILYFQLKGEGFVKHRCPVCGELFASKYQITSKLFINPPVIQENVKYKPAEKADLEEEIAIHNLVKPAFQNRHGMKCSNACRALALKEMGIDWDPTRKPESRWLIANPIDPERNVDGELPVIVPPPAYELMQKLHDIEPQYIDATAQEEEKEEEEVIN